MTDPAFVAASLTRHAASPDVSVRKYVAELMATLGDSMSGLKKFYLDTRYWVLLRDAAMGRPRDPAQIEILYLLRRLVREGVAICPVSDAAWMELSKQTDRETYRATADLLDELSQGIAILSEQQRVVAEIRQFLTQPLEASTSPVLRHRVWVKAGYVLGLLVPTSDQLSPEQNRLIQKSSIDLFWSTTHRQIADESGPLPPMPDGFAGSAERINEAMARYSHQIRSIQQAFAAESAGILSVFAEDITGIVLQHYRDTTGDPTPVPQSQATETGRKALTALTNALRLKPKLMAARVPTVYAYAMCHAAVRMDKRRKFDGHDLVDIHHAACGIPYHDAVFTETPLRVLVTAGNVALDRTFNCTVMSRDDEIIEFLRKTV